MDPGSFHKSPDKPWSMVEGNSMLSRRILAVRKSVGISWKQLLMGHCQPHGRLLFSVLNLIRNVVSFRVFLDDRAGCMSTEPLQPQTLNL
jgi:hypothetical protein